MEYWFVKGAFFYLSVIKANLPYSQSLRSPETHYSNIPPFQHSNWSSAIRSYSLKESHSDLLGGANEECIRQNNLHWEINCL